MDLAFLVDIMHELSVLNKKLQGQGQFVCAAYDNVRAFSTKLLLKKHSSLRQTFAISQHTRHLWMQAHRSEKYVNAIVELREEFDYRFADFKTHRATFQMCADRFSFDVQDAPPGLQVELKDLQCSSDLKAKFREVSGKTDKLWQFVRELSPSFP